jgi:hypothetical protein
MDGTTVVFHDTSGSMSTTVSRQSTVSCNMAGAMLAAIVAKRCEKAYIGAFSSEVKMITFTKRDSVIAIAKRLIKTNVGCATYMYKCMDLVKAQGIKPARIIITSDMQCYNYAGGWSSTTPMCDLWDSFRKSNNGKDCWLHSIHLNGSGDTPVDEKGKVNQTAGFSEKIFNQLIDAEVRVESKSKDESGSPEASLPSIEMIREMYE